jgi:hypothetical protein
MEEKLKMTKERFDNVRKMLESPDLENQVIGLSILEEQDFISNSAFILLCKKYSVASNQQWELHAPKLYAQMKSIPNLDVEKTLTFKSILEALTKIKAPYEQIQFYLMVFSAYLYEQLRNLGYDFIENLELNIKLKSEYEQSGESG